MESGRIEACYARAVNLLARRPHFRRGLTDKLIDKGFEEAEVTPVVERLAGEGYLDDVRCALDLATGRMARNLWGPRRMRAELGRRGAPEEAVEAALDTAFRDGEEPAAREATRRWQARGGRERDALARHLDRKGFSSGAIVAMVRELGASTGNIDHEG